MKILSKIKDLNLKASAYITIGNFDGLHLGHQKIIQSLLERSKVTSSKSVVMTFSPHPIEYFNPEFRLKKIQFAEEFCSELMAMGIDLLINQKFDHEFSQLEPLDFLELIKRHLNPKGLVVGYDFKFGKRQTGDFGVLEEFCRENSIELIKEPPFSVSEEVVSSTLIRNKISQGEIESANRFLGKKYFVKGEVVKGEGKGKGLGFPTLNLKTQQDLFLKPGVYRTTVKVRDEWLISLSNFGWAPTVKNMKEPCLETHILNWDESIYGEEVTISFEAFLRPELKFNSVDELKSQIQKDLMSILPKNQRQ